MYFTIAYSEPYNGQRGTRTWFKQTHQVFAACRGRINGVDDLNSLNLLPHKMKTELAIHIHLDTLKKVRCLLTIYYQPITNQVSTITITIIITITLLLFRPSPSPYFTSVLYFQLSSPSVLHHHRTSPSVLHHHLTSPSVLHDHVTLPSALHHHLTSPSVLHDNLTSPLVFHHHLTLVLHYDLNSPSVLLLHFHFFTFSPSSLPCITFSPSISTSFLHHHLTSPSPLVIHNRHNDHKFTRTKITNTNQLLFHCPTVGLVPTKMSTGIFTWSLTQNEADNIHARGPDYPSWWNRARDVSYQRWNCSNHRVRVMDFLFTIYWPDLTYPAKTTRKFHQVCWYLTTDLLNKPISSCQQTCWKLIVKICFQLVMLKSTSCNKLD